MWESFARLYLEVVQSFSKKARLTADNDFMVFILLIIVDHGEMCVFAVFKKSKKKSVAVSET